MLETLTARDFLSILSLATVEKLFCEAFATGNVTALYTVSNNIKDRNRQDLFPELIASVYSTGYDMPYCSPVREALISILDEARKAHPLNCLNLDIVLGKWKKTDKQALSFEDYFVLMDGYSDEYYDTFCRMMTPYDFAKMDQRLLDILKDHYGRVCLRALPEGSVTVVKDPTDRQHCADALTAANLKLLFREQIEKIGNDEALAEEMLKNSYGICQYFGIEKPVSVNITTL